MIDAMQKILPPNANYGTIGIANNGGTCYVSSCIQCLSNCLELTHYFLSMENICSTNLGYSNKMQGDIARAYFDLICKLWHENKYFIDASKLREIVAKSYRIFM